MSGNGGQDRRSGTGVDDFLEEVGVRVGSVVAGVGRALKRWGSQLATDHRPPRERAEDVVSGIEEHVGDYTAGLGHGIRRVAARAKEELDDIRAEATVKKEQWTAKPEASSEQKTSSTAE